MPASTVKRPQEADAQTDAVHHLDDLLQDLADAQQRDVRVARGQAGPAAPARPRGSWNAASRICGKSSSTRGSTTRKKLMPNVRQFTVRRLVTVRSIGIPWMSKQCVEPRWSPMSCGEVLLDAHLGALADRPSSAGRLDDLVVRRQILCM